MSMTHEQRAQRAHEFQRLLANAASHLRAARDVIVEPAPRTTAKLDDMAAYCDVLIRRAQADLRAYIQPNPDAHLGAVENEHAC